jgi:hypothetical protein
LTQDERITRYLNELCWAMGGSFAEQQAVRDELRADIDAAVRDHELSGMGSDAALAAALRELGDPTRLGDEMKSSRGTDALRRPLVQPEGAVLLEPRHVRPMPSLPLLLTLSVAALLAIAVVIAYAWP